jgi:GH35 family endo-1,4-beta-xylanase
MTKVFNRACKADPKEKLFLKNFQSFKKNKKRKAHPTRQ